MIDVTITACDRPDLLMQTLDSFFQFADLPLGKIYVHEDSGKRGVNDSVLEKYPHIVMLEAVPKNGQIRALDILAECVQTEYFFSLEEDWKFDRAGFMAASMDVLQSVPSISEVWLRYPNERNSHPAIGVRRKAQNGTQYQMLKTHYRQIWHGTSFGPTLRRKKDRDLIGPYSKLTTFNPKSPLDSEVAVGNAYLKHGFRAATLLTGYCKHIGSGRHCN
jgi:hypothetical protein